jgi:hypothetical protein
MASHHIEDGAGDFLRDSTTSALCVEVNDGVESSLDAEFPHGPSISAGQLADVGEGLVYVAERHVEVLCGLRRDGEKGRDGALRLRVTWRWRAASWRTHWRGSAIATLVRLFAVSTMTMFVFGHRIVFSRRSGSRVATSIVCVEGVERSTVTFATITRDARWVTRARVIGWSWFCSSDIIVDVWYGVLAIVT